MTERPSLVGRWYAAGPADKPFDPADRDFAIFRIVSDHDPLPGCVTVETASGRRFPLARAFAERIALDEPPEATAERLRGQWAARAASPE